MKEKLLEVDFSNDTAVIKFEGDYFLTSSEYVIYEKKDFEQLEQQAEVLLNENRELKKEIGYLINKNKELAMEIESKRPKITKNYE